VTSTTTPAISTDLADFRTRPNHVRWVFPQHAELVLTERHVVGREPGCDCVLPGNELSRRHAEFRVDGPVVAVRDLQSRNGVFVNGGRVTDAPLALGDVVRCGEWVGIVTAAAPGGEFREIAAGWHGGATLAAAAEPARRIASDLPVIVEGETGTGKEGMARAVHTWSGRRGPFVAVNCAALPTELAEAELFGYRKGAFTGADGASAGLFRAAQGGTLFLDEILELPLPLQAKLLRVLQERQVRGLGETRDVAIDVRIVAATQEPLAAAVNERRFRADLHARLDGLTIVLPPLRKRREDIVPLFTEFLRQQRAVLPELEPKLIEALCVYDWPLNVRELQLLARRLLSLHGAEPVLRRVHLPERIAERELELARATSPVGPPGKPLNPHVQTGPRKRAWRKTDDELEFEALIAALRSHGGNVAKAAASLGVGRARAYRILSAHPDFSLEAMRGEG
jgi:transcriptional regulator with AAA-type ATPase domain